jgi:hypothetical protein
VPGPYSSPTSVTLWLHFSGAPDCGEAAAKADLVRGAAQSTDAAQNGFSGVGAARHAISCVPGRRSYRADNRKAGWSSGSRLVLEEPMAAWWTMSSTTSSRGGSNGNQRRNGSRGGCTPMRPPGRFRRPGPRRRCLTPAHVVR